jgi:hypothetical protein
LAGEEERARFGVVGEVAGEVWGADGVEMITEDPRGEGGEAEGVLGWSWRGAIFDLGEGGDDKGLVWGWEAMDRGEGGEDNEGLTCAWRKTR